MTRCVNCVRLERENQELRALVLALWDDWRKQSQRAQELASGRFSAEPVPPLRMLARVLEDAA